VKDWFFVVLQLANQRITKRNLGPFMTKDENLIENEPIRLQAFLSMRLLDCLLELRVLPGPTTDKIKIVK
jgi:hypothetical protein